MLKRLYFLRMVTNLAENTKKEFDFKVDFRKYDSIKTGSLKKN